MSSNKPNTASIDPRIFILNVFPAGQNRDIVINNKCLPFIIVEKRHMIHSFLIELLIFKKCLKDGFIKANAIETFYQIIRA